MIPCTAGQSKPGNITGHRVVLVVFSSIFKQTNKKNRKKDFEIEKIKMAKSGQNLGADVTQLMDQLERHCLAPDGSLVTKSVYNDLQLVLNISISISLFYYYYYFLSFFNLLNDYVSGA